MTFTITGLPADEFKHLYGLSDEELKKHGSIRYVVNEKPGFPDRIEMREGEIGETMLLVNHFHQPAQTPYRGSHAIFVREGATHTYSSVNLVPEVMLTRMLSLRAFDREDMMLDADVVEGKQITPLIERFFSNENVHYIHVHNAKRGCFSGRIDRLTKLM